MDGKQKKKKKVNKFLPTVLFFVLTSPTERYIFVKMGQGPEVRDMKN